MVLELVLNAFDKQFAHPRLVRLFGAAVPAFEPFKCLPYHGVHRTCSRMSPCNWCVCPFPC